LFLTLTQTGKLIWGIGPALNIPTSSSSELGGDVFGINANLNWFCKNDDLNAFFGQYMIVYTIKKGVAC